MKSESQGTGNRVVTGVGIMVLALATAGLFHGLLPPAMREWDNHDYIFDYAPVADNLLRGQGLTYPEGDFADAYPPGYPLILAGLFAVANALSLSREVVLTAFHLVVLALSAVSLFAISEMLWGRRWAVIPPVLFCTYPLTLWLSRQPMSEIPFMLFYYTAVYYLIKGIKLKKIFLHFFISGILVGAAILIRPIALASGIIFSLIIPLAYHDKTIRAKVAGILWLNLGVVLALSPWIAFAYYKTGNLILVSTNLGPSIFDGWTFAVNPEAAHRLPFPLSTDLRAWMEAFLRQCAGRLSTSEVVACLVGRFQEDPVTGMKLALWKGLRAWYGTNSGRWETAIILVQLLYLPLMAGAAVLGLRRRDSVREAALLIILVLVYFWGITTVVLSIVRYLVPAIGLGFLVVPAIFRRESFCGSP